MPPKFTVVTITYNSSKYVRQAIESVLAQTYTDFEYIISDDCSTDKTWEIIQEYNDPRIRAWRNEKNIGEYPNRNKTLFTARGEYILWIDGDDIIFKNSLLTISLFLDYFPDSHMIWGVPHQRFSFCVLPYEFTPLDTLSIIYRTVIPTANIGFAETIFKTSILKETGGMDVKYKIGDVYLKKKLASTYKTLMVPIGFSFWREHNNQASKKALLGDQSFIDALLIDNEIRSILTMKTNVEEFKTIIRNIRVRQIKSLINNSLFKFKFSLFLKMYRKLNLSFVEIFLFFTKAEVGFQFNCNGANPLMNDYNFQIN